MTFDDGLSRDFDAIVAATGFRAGVESFLEPHDYSFDAKHASYTTSAAGLYFCGFSVTPTGMFREIGIEARRIAQHIAVALPI